MKADEAWNEFIAGIALAEEASAKLAEKALALEHRIYYDPANGAILGLYVNEYPAGDDYIVIPDPEIFRALPIHRTVIENGQIKISDPEPNQLPRCRLKKSSTGQRVVKGHAALALEAEELYTNIEYYERKTNN